MDMLSTTPRASFTPCFLRGPCPHCTTLERQPEVLRKPQALCSLPPNLSARPRGPGPPDRWHERSAPPFLGCPSGQVHVPRALGLQRANCVCPTLPQCPHTAVKATSGKQGWITPVVPPDPFTGFHPFARHRHAVPSALKVLLKERTRVPASRRPYRPGPAPGTHTRPTVTVQVASALGNWEGWPAGSDCPKLSPSQWALCTKWQRSAGRGEGYKKVG